MTQLFTELLILETLSFVLKFSLQFSYTITKSYLFLKYVFLGSLPIETNLGNNTQWKKDRSKEKIVHHLWLVLSKKKKKDGLAENVLDIHIFQEHCSDNCPHQSKQKILLSKHGLCLFDQDYHVLTFTLLPTSFRVSIYYFLFKPLNASLILAIQTRLSLYLNKQIAHIYMHTWA